MTIFGKAVNSIEIILFIEDPQKRYLVHFVFNQRKAKLGKSQVQFYKKLNRRF